MTQMTTHEPAPLPTSAATINALFAQRNAVTALISAGELFEAKALLDLLHPLWNSLGYGYKGRELYRTIREAARKQIGEEQAFLAGERKNSRMRLSTEANIGRLEKLAQEC